MRIKSIHAKTYEITMYETELGFQVEYNSHQTGYKASEILQDYHTADLLFDIKLSELEGQ